MHRCPRLGSPHHCPSGCLECRCNIKHQLMLETSYLVMETHANSTLSKCMPLACAYQSAKENGHCHKKILPRLWTTIWQRGTLWKTLFQNKPSGTLNPVYLPRKLLNNTKNVSINKTLSITTLAQYFYPATLEEHPINNYDPDRVLFWKTCTAKKCINVYTLDLG